MTSIPQAGQDVLWRGHQIGRVLGVFDTDGKYPHKRVAMTWRGTKGERIRIVNLEHGINGLSFDTTSTPDESYGYYYRRAVSAERQIKFIEINNRSGMVSAGYEPVEYTDSEIALIANLNEYINKCMALPHDYLCQPVQATASAVALAA